MSPFTHSCCFWKQGKIGLSILNSLGFHFIKLFCWNIQYCWYENSCAGKTDFLFGGIIKQCYTLRGSLFISYIVEFIPLANLLRFKSWPPFSFSKIFAITSSPKNCIFFSATSPQPSSQRKGLNPPVSQSKGMCVTCVHPTEKPAEPAWRLRVGQGQPRSVHLQARGCCLLRHRAALQGSVKGHVETSLLLQLSHCFLVFFKLPGLVLELTWHHSRLHFLKINYWCIASV